MNPNPKHQEWIRELAVAIRGRFDSIPEDVRFGPGYLAFFLKPAQVFSVSLENPPMTWMFVTHVNGSPDLSIRAYGPLTPPELLSVLEDERKDPLLDNLIPEGGGLRLAPPAPPVLRSYYEREAGGFLERIRGGVFDSSGGGRQGASYLPVCNVLTFQSDLFAKTPQSTLDSWVKEESEGPLAEMRSRWRRENAGKSRTEILDEARRQIEERDRRMDWRAVFFYPPVRVGERPATTLREQMPGAVAPFDLGEVKVEDSLLGAQFWATFYGCFGLKESDDRKAALMLNLVCSALHLSGHESFPVRQGELLKVEYDSSTKSFLGTSTPPSERAAGNKDLSRRRFKTFGSVSTDEVRVAVRLAEKFSKDPSLCLWLPLVLDAFARMDAREWDHAFYSAWLIIESDIVERFDAGIANGTITEATYVKLRMAGASDPKIEALPRKLKGVEDAGVKFKLETLNLYTLVTPQDYAAFDGLRIRRNEILHPAVPATEKDARVCYQAAESIVRSRV